MNILSLTAHAVEEHDMIVMLSGLGHAVYSPGGYIDPEHPHDTMRPPIPRTELTWHPELKEATEGAHVCDNAGCEYRAPWAIAQGRGLPGDPLGHGPHPDVLWNAKDDLPDALIEWADVIMVHHVEHRWLWPQWDRVEHKRVIWRTVGQSVHVNEDLAQPFAGGGLEIVRYSPQERNIPNYAGEDALIRFWKDPAEWHGWTGEDAHVLLVVQDPVNRGNEGGWINYAWIKAVTDGLPVRWVGPGSEGLGGLGKVPPEQLMAEMRSARCALYTGTQPASYTLALIELMMTGTPVVSIGPEMMGLFPYSPKLFEGHLIAPIATSDPSIARKELERLLEEPAHAQRVSEEGRTRAVELFGKERIWGEWRDYLDGKGAP